MLNFQHNADNSAVVFTAATDACDFVGCADLSMSEYALDELISNATNADYSTDYSYNFACGLIAAIHADNLTDCADL